MFVFTQISLRISANAFWVQNMLNILKFFYSIALVKGFANMAGDLL